MAIQRVENITIKNVAIARAAYQAYVTKDRAALENLIARDFHFTSPIDNGLDRETYFRRCWPNSKTIERFDFVNLVTDGDRVFVTYERAEHGWSSISEHGNPDYPGRAHCRCRGVLRLVIAAQGAAGRIRERRRT